MAELGKDFKKTFLDFLVGVTKSCLTLVTQ